MKIKSMILSIVLAVALLGTLGIVFTDRVVAEPSAPNTITIDTCTETNFDNALAAAHSGDVIDVRCLTSFPAGPGVIAFSTQKTISKSITILGTHPVTGVNRLSGGDAIRLFVVNNGATLTLTNITLEHGYSTSSGGCLSVFSSLVALTTTLQHCQTFSLLGTPDGGAIYATGANLTLTNTTFFSNTADGDGGGLYVYNSTVVASRSRFDSNLANHYGGGLYQQLGRASFNATALTSNTARYYGGGLYVTEVPTFYLQSNSRVEHNRTTDLYIALGGGAYFTASRPYIQEAFFGDNRVQQNGGGIYSENSALALYRSIIADNVAQQGTGGGIDLHGGANESAIENTLFQSNFSGAYGGAIFNAGQLSISHTQFGQNDGYEGGGIFNAFTGDLHIDYTLFEQNTAELGAGLLNNGSLNYGMWLTLTQNVAGSVGGGLYSGNVVNNQATLTHVLFLNNKSGGEGGGLSAYGGTLSLYDAQLVGNQADRDGGGLSAGNDAFIRLDSSSVTGNRVKHNGAGVWARDATIQIDNSALTDNTIDHTDDFSSGGGIYITSTAAATLTLNNVQVDRNQIGYKGSGGGVYMYGGKATLNNVTLNDNLASGAAVGGGLYLENSTASVNELTANGNLGFGVGGGIALQKANLNLSNAVLKHNAAIIGGGIRALNSTLVLNGVTVSDQDSGTTSDGAGIDCYNCQGTWQNVTLSHNVGKGRGGGLHAYLSNLTIQRSTFEGNLAESGGGIYNHDTTLQLINVTLSGNQATGSGGGIYNGEGSIDPSVITLTNVTLKDNGAVQGGGFFNSNGPDTQAYLKNTVIADSTSAGNCSGKVFTSATYSLSTDLTCALSGTGDQNNVVAKLNPLSWVGGSTKVHLPSLDSPLLNMIIGSDYPATDQRGIVRPQGPGADVGAVERQPSDPIYGLLVYLPLVIR